MEGRAPVSLWDRGTLGIAELRPARSTRQKCLQKATKRAKMNFKPQSNALLPSFPSVRLDFGGASSCEPLGSREVR
jgi:hypothetical protein